MNRALMTIEPQVAPEPTTAQTRKAHMFIDGEHVDALDGQTFEVTTRPPARSSPAFRWPARPMSTGLWRRRKRHLKARTPKWSAAKRGRTLQKFADLVKKNVEELAQIDRENVGKPIAASRGESFAVSLVLEYYAGAANKHFGETIPTSLPGFDFTLREPIGVVARDRALELPAEHGRLEAWAGAGDRQHVHHQASVVDAAVGNPAGRAGARGRFSAGRRQRRHRPGGTVGAALAAHPGVGKVAFTGETTTGQEIMRLAANNVKKISLELGGKIPNIVFADADLEKFAAAAPHGRLRQRRPELHGAQPDPRRAICPRPRGRACRPADGQARSR